jgi:hypothetical protein
VELTGSRGTLGRGSRGLIIAAALLLAACVFAQRAEAVPAYRCTGTPQSPGVLSGQYLSRVLVEGVCKVDSGRVIVRGNLVVREDSTLLAAYGQEQPAGSGPSNLTVHGRLRVLKGGTALLGCEPGHFACLNDPDPKDPTLSGRTTIFGNLFATEALGVVVHNSRIFGRVRQIGGGGGTNCEPTGPFLELGLPAVYSDYEDTSIRGNINVRLLESCWLGLARLQVAGNMRVNQNQLADPDAIEILSNVIRGNLVCRGNSQVWDSADLTEELYPRAPEPNTVFGQRRGQCRLASPETEGGEPGPGPF